MSTDAERLMTHEYRQSKITQVQNAIPDASVEECEGKLQLFRWDVEQVIRHIKIERLLRLGLTDRSKCESALQRTNWNVELAASSMLE